MGEVTQYVNGGLENRAQQEIVVGDGSIVTYHLSEHQFEELGNNKDYISYQNRVFFCLGIIIPLAIDVLSWTDTIYCLSFLWKCVFLLTFTFVLIFSTIEFFIKRKKAKSIYDTLKEQARILTERAKQ